MRHLVSEQCVKPWINSQVNHHSMRCTSTYNGSRQKRWNTFLEDYSSRIWLIWRHLMFYHVLVVAILLQWRNCPIFLEDHRQGAPPAPVVWCWWSFIAVHWNRAIWIYRDFPIGLLESPIYWVIPELIINQQGFSSHCSIDWQMLHEIEICPSGGWIVT